MKKTVKIFFDFLCPYCYKSIFDLIDLLPDFPELTIDWQPCEAHPRPEERSIYSDLASEAFLYIKGHKGDMISFIKDVYLAHFEESKRIDDKEVLVALSEKTGVEVGRFRSSLIRRDYKQDIMTNNQMIWEVYESPSVPAYYCRNKKLMALEDKMISKEELRQFLSSL